MGEGQCSRVLKCLGNGSATLMARMCPSQVTDTKLSQIYNPLLPTSVCTLHPLLSEYFLTFLDKSICLHIEIIFLPLCGHNELLQIINLLFPRPVLTMTYFPKKCFPSFHNSYAHRKFAKKNTKKAGRES